MDKTIIGLKILKKKIANFISIIGYPLLTIPVFILFKMFEFETISKAILISSLIIGGIFVPVILWMFLKSKNGTYTNFDVSDKIQRRSLFSFIVTVLIIVTVLLFVVDQSNNIIISSLFALILIIVSQATNYFIKSSLHVSLNIYLSSLIFPFSYKIGISVFLFTLAISWARIELGRHSIKEILLGWIIGIIISFTMLKFQGYI